LITETRPGQQTTVENTITTKADFLTPQFATGGSHRGSHEHIRGQHKEDKKGRSVSNYTNLFW